MAKTGESHSRDIRLSPKKEGFIKIAGRRKGSVKRETLPDGRRCTSDHSEPG